MNILKTLINAFNNYDNHNNLDNFRACQLTHDLYRTLFKLQVAPYYVALLSCGSTMPYVMNVKHKMKTSSEMRN